MPSGANQLADFGASFIPTPAEIAEGCARIQATWDAREERSRRLWAIEAGRLRSPRVSGFDEEFPFARVHEE